MKEIRLAKAAADPPMQPTKKTGNEIWLINCMVASKDIQGSRY